jgi:hypothetical protein
VLANLSVTVEVLCTEGGLATVLEVPHTPPSPA